MALGAHKRYAITHPTVVEQSKAGKFTFRKLYHSFSALPLVQTHNQNNKAIKGDGGAIGLAENQKLRWMIGGREIANLVLKFEDPVSKDSGAQYSHHEQVTGKQNRFQKHVKQVEEKFAAMGSPFMDDSTELVSMIAANYADVVKAAVVSPLENLCETTPNMPEATAVVLDGAAVVNFNPLGTSNKF